MLIIWRITLVIWRAENRSRFILRTPVNPWAEFPAIQQISFACIPLSSVPSSETNRLKQTWGFVSVVEGVLWIQTIRIVLCGWLIKDRAWRWALVLVSERDQEERNRYAFPKLYALGMIPQCMEKPFVQLFLTKLRYLNPFLHPFFSKLLYKLTNIKSWCSLA